VAGDGRRAKGGVDAGWKAVDHDGRNDPYSRGLVVPARGATSMMRTAALTDD
jgi:hypothetical protein